MSRYSGKLRNPQSMPARRDSRDIPSTSDRFFISASRTSGRLGAIPNPQLPITTVVTPSAGEGAQRSEEHTSELQSLMRISYAVFCLKKKKDNKQPQPYRKKEYYSKHQNKQ